jgi:hypothetical protein
MSVRSTVRVGGERKFYRAEMFELSLGLHVPVTMSLGLSISGLNVNFTPVFSPKL